MIKAAAQEQCPVVHPEQPGFDGVTIAQLSGPAAHGRRRLAELRRRLDRDARLEQAVDVDGCHRSIAVRYGHLRQDGDPARAGTTRPQSGFPARRRARHRLHRSAGRDTKVGNYAAVVPTLGGQAWITGHGDVRRRSGGSVSGRFHRRRHLVTGVATPHQLCGTEVPVMLGAFVFVWACHCYCATCACTYKHACGHVSGFSRSQACCHGLLLKEPLVRFTRLLVVAAIARPAPHPYKRSRSTAPMIRF